MPTQMRLKLKAGASARRLTVADAQLTVAGLSQLGAALFRLDGRVQLRAPGRGDPEGHWWVVNEDTVLLAKLEQARRAG